MNWSEYAYLAAAALGAGAALMLLIRCMPALSKPSRTRTPAELAFLVGIAALALFTIYGNFYLGRSFFAYTVNDPGSDVIEQYVPFYVNLIGNVRDGTFSLWDFWSFEYGLGVNAAGYQSWLFDPFNLLVVPLGLLLGDAHLAIILIAVHSLKVLLSALLFDHFLTRYCAAPVSRILGAVLYALSGYLIVYGQQYWLGSAFVAFTAALLVFELYLERASAPRFLILTAIVAVIVGWTAYIAFMILLFEAIYLLLRIPHYQPRGGARAYFKSVGRLCAPVICGLLLAGVSLVPYALFLLTETTRTASTMSLSERLVSAATSFVNPDWIPTILSRAMGSALITTGLAPMGDALSGSEAIEFSSNYIYDFILLGYSCGAFILLSQFFHWVVTEGDRAVKALVGIACALIALYCVNFLLPTVFTAFVRVQYRSCFMIAAPACTAMALGFEKRILPGRIASKPLVAGTLASLVALGWSAHLARMGRFDVFFSTCALIWALCTLALISRIPARRPALLAVFIALLVSSSAVDGFMVSNERIHVAGDWFPLAPEARRGDATEAALDWIREHDQGLYRIEKAYLDWVPLNDSMIEHYPSVSAYNSTPDSDVDEFYRKLWPEAVSPWAAYSQGYYYDPDRPAIMELLGVRYILAKEPLAFSWCEPVAEVGEVTIYRNVREHSIATLAQHVVGESEADALADAEARRALLETSVIVPDEVAADLEGGLAGGEAPASFTASFTEEEVGRVSGTIACEADSVVCLSIPNTGTWHVLVDGVEVETFRADFGFIGFALAAGTHEIEAVYELAGSRLGAALSLAGIAATTTTALILARRTRPIGVRDHLGGCA